MMDKEQVREMLKEKGFTDVRIKQLTNKIFQVNAKRNLGKKVNYQFEVKNGEIDKDSVSCWS